MAKYEMYTDGACRSKGLGAYAYVILKDGKPLTDHACLVDETTNNRMELSGVLEGLKKFDPSTAQVSVFSDSAYVVNCFLQKWYAGWRKKSWKNSSNEPVKNRDLWEELLAVVENFKHPIEWCHVKGHSGNQWNEHVDSLCDGMYQKSGVGGFSK